MRHIGGQKINNIPYIGTRLLFKPHLPITAFNILLTLLAMLKMCHVSYYHLKKEWNANNIQKNKVERRLKK